MSGTCWKQTGAFLLTCAAMHATGAARAEVLFMDTFARADSLNIDESLAGITDNTGSSLAADGVYAEPFRDPEGDDDGNATDAGLGRIIGETLELAFGVGTSNAYVNHNFTNSSLFTVSVDVSDYAQTSADFGGAFAVGMSSAEAGSTGDAFKGHPVGDNVPVGPKMQEAFGAEGTSAADFWLALRGDATLAWGGLGDDNLFGTASVPAKVGTISASFSAPDFSAGATVDYRVFHDGVEQGSGSFTWSGDNENFIGLDARGNGVNFDNFTVTAVPEPSTALLSVLGVFAIRSRRRAA